MTEEYTALDLETTGLNPKKDKIIEIGAVKVREGRIMDSFQCFVNPWRKLGEETRLLTGIDDGMLQDAPGIEEVLEPLIDFIGEDVLVGHRILFDYSFVKKAAVNRSLVFEKEGIDTLKLARKLLPDLESRKLGDLCNYYGIAHRRTVLQGNAYRRYRTVCGRRQGCKEERYGIYRHELRLRIRGADLYGR